MWSGRSATVRRGAAAACSVLLTLAITGCTESTPHRPAPTPDLGTPLGQVDTTALRAARTDFCTLLDDAAIERALGGAVTRQSSYRSGEKVQITSDVTDVAHEYSCTFQAGPTATARAWVFAPPVTAKRARLLVRDLKHRAGCEAVPDAPALGQPSVALSCTDKRRTTVSFHGLVGDAWLSCSRSWSGAQATASADAAPGERLDVVGRWCAEVLSADTGG